MDAIPSLKPSIMSYIHMEYAHLLDVQSGVILSAIIVGSCFILEYIQKS